jgi:hypothetical protein
LPRRPEHHDVRLLEKTPVSAAAGQRLRMKGREVYVSLFSGWIYFSAHSEGVSGETVRAVSRFARTCPAASGSPKQGHESVMFTAFTAFRTDASHS